MARQSSGVIQFTAVALANTLLYTLSPTVTKVGVVKKIRWINRTGANGRLTLGYVNAAAVFVPVFPDILMVNGVDDCLKEDELPIFGNGPKGFVADTTPLTGTTGAIWAQSTVAGAAGLNVEVIIEVEEI